MKKDVKSFNISIVYLRVIATLLILLHHTLYLFSGWESRIIGQGDLVYSISRFSKYAGLGIFFFISGMLVARHAKKKSPTKFFNQKFKRIIIPGLLIAIPYSLLNDANYFKIFFGSFIWYLPTLFILMLSCSFFINNKKVNITNILINLFIIFICLYLLSKHINSFFFNCISYFSSFYLGFYFDNAISKISNRIKIVLLILLNLFLVILFNSKQLNLLYPFVVSPILALDLYIIVKFIRHTSKLLLLINRYSMQIYLFQCFFLLMLYNFCDYLNLNLSYSIFVIFIVTLILCILTCKIYEKIKNQFSRAN